jgi:hypothetical protein
MKKTIMTLGILVVTSLVFSAFTTTKDKLNNELITKTEEIFRECGDGYVEVSWSVDCPNGNNYSGSRCFRDEHALEAAETIAGAPCPN